MGRSRRSDASTFWSKWSLYYALVKPRRIQKRENTHGNARGEQGQSGGDHANPQPGWFDEYSRHQGRGGHGLRHEGSWAIVKHEHVSSRNRKRGEKYISQNSNALPFPLRVSASISTLICRLYSQNRCGRSDKVDRRILAASLGGMLFLSLCFREA